MIVIVLIKRTRLLNYVSHLNSLIASDLFQSIGRHKMCLILFELFDRQWSFTNHRSNMYLIWTLWSSVTSCIALVVQICVLFKLYYRHWSLIDLWSFKYVLYKLYYRHWSLIDLRLCEYISWKYLMKANWYTYLLVLIFVRVLCCMFSINFSK